LMFYMSLLLCYFFEFWLIAKVDDMVIC